MNAATADLTSELAVILSREQPELMAWRNNAERVIPAPRVQVVDAVWTGNSLRIKLANGQTFMGVFTETTDMADF